MDFPSRSPYDPPAQPYPGLLAKQYAAIEQAIADTPPLESAHDGATEAVRSATSAHVEDLAAGLVDLSHEIHGHPELAFEEHEAARAVSDLLAKHGHDASVGVHGLDTALRAEAGTGERTVAVLAEYDALPGMGHACGHNVIAATAVGAFLALARVVDELDGRVVLLGTPAEEGGGGKELMARHGAFEGIDASVMLHPFGVEAASHPWLGVKQLGVSYHGLSAHAAAMPHLGRNALDAAVAAYQGLAQLRQHMLPNDRLHATFAEGGQRPNIVPERAKLDVYLRSTQPDGLGELIHRAREIFEGAALQTGTRLEIDWEPCPVYLPMRNNQTLAARWAQNVAPRGRRALPEGVLPEHLTASSDCGNVSVRVPAIQPLLRIAPPDVTIHTPAFADWAGGEEADRGVVDGAVGLALTAADYLADAQLRGAAHAEFEAAGGLVDVDAFA